MILVTGATGRAGQAVVRTLRRVGLDTRALVRKGSEYYWLNDTGCRYFFGDLRDPTSLGRALEGKRYLVICSGVRRESQDNNLDNVTRKGHADLLALARSAGLARVVLISCLGADKGSAAPVHAARAGLEDAVASSGLDYTILRASAHEHLFVDLAWRVRQTGSVWLPGKGDNRLNPLPTADLGRMAVASLDLEGARNRRIDLGGAETASAREWFERACTVAGVAASGRAIPSPLVGLGSRLGRPLRRYAHRLSEAKLWFERDLTVDTAEADALFALPHSTMKAAMETAFQRQLALSDPEERERRITHRNFYATVYEPNVPAEPEAPIKPAR